ncbi:hypothetical protein [Caballeronia sp. 15711]|uniref:hypothetical protein n=1 Tax=Caballeronia sp. 15711 TaxID=3391029 RepID=UPI0039E5974D
MPEQEFDALLGHGQALQKRYEVPEVLGGALVTFPDWRGAELFSEALRSEAHRVGTNPWVRDYDEPSYQKAWDVGSPLFSD